MVEEAARSHPVLVDGDRYRGSTLYGGAAHAADMFEHALDTPEAAAGEDRDRVAAFPRVRRRRGQGDGRFRRRGRRHAPGIKPNRQDRRGDPAAQREGTRSLHHLPFAFHAARNVMATPFMQ